MTKSIQHDATPSWNGFNYQGKVGVYVCLTMILDALKGCGKDSNSFKEFIESHSIQYEWIEDFSILKDGQYVSHHQVKHKAETRFSTHIDALVTILNRTQKILSTSDLARYLNNKNSEETNIQALKEMNALELDGSLNPNWRKIPGIEESEYYTCLDEFDQFSANAFDKSRIYFHTSETVSEPEKDLSTYEDIKANTHLSSKLKGKKTLKSLKDLEIYLGEDQDHPYRLVLSDTKLQEELTKLVTHILEITHEGETFKDEIKQAYLDSLMGIVDNHIRERHASIRKEEYANKRFLKKVESISFKRFFESLQLLLQNHSKEFMELFCRGKFEKIYVEKTDQLRRVILNKKNQNDFASAKEYKQRFNQLEFFRLHYLMPLYEKRFRHLFRELAPNILQIDCKNGKTVKKSKLSFYTDLVNTDGVNDVFLAFIERLELKEAPITLSFPCNGKNYYPSIVDLSSDDELYEQDNIMQFQETMTYLPKYYDPNDNLINANYFIVRASLNNPIDNQGFTLKKITNISKDEVKEETITSNKIRLKEYRTTIQEINNGE